MKKTYLLSITALLILAASASALKNPMRVYCERLGYEYKTVSSGSVAVGYCILPDGTRCPATEFVQGKCGAEYSYCAKKGYLLKPGDGEARCVTGDGTEAWVTQLVKDDAELGPYEEEKLVPYCGNRLCEPGEDTGSCPSDCPSITTTAHILCGNNMCDPDESEWTCPLDCGPKASISDILCGNGVCDSGEDPGNCPADCKKAGYGMTALIALIAVAAIYLLMKSKSSAKKGGLE